MPLPLSKDNGDYNIQNRLNEIAFQLSVADQRITALVTLLDSLRTGNPIHCSSGEEHIPGVINEDAHDIKQELYRTRSYISELESAKSFWEKLLTCLTTINTSVQQSTASSVSSATIVCLDPHDISCNQRRIRDLEYLLTCLILGQEPHETISGIDNADANKIREELTSIKNTILSDACPSSSSSSGGSCTRSCPFNCFQNPSTCNCICPTYSLVCNQVPLPLSKDNGDYNIRNRLN